VAVTEKQVADTLEQVPSIGHRLTLSGCAKRLKRPGMMRLLIPARRLCHSRFPEARAEMPAAPVSWSLPSFTS
jgi:hypothetical protein